MSALDDVISTVLRAREDGPDALAAVALSFGSAMELGTLGNAALKARLAATRAALEATEATVTTLRTERDAASAAAKAARQRMEEVRVEAERDEAREALAAKDSAPDLDYPARAEVWKLREAVDALRARAERAEAERDRAVREREAFSLRASAAERARDEAREALDISRESAREAREEIAGALALVDEARAALDAALARPTYEARTVAPTTEECAAHRVHSGWWIIADADEDPRLRCLGDLAEPVGAEGRTWLAIGADGLPCAWPVVP